MTIPHIIVAILSRFWLLVLWTLSLIAIWKFKRRLPGTVDGQARFFLYYTLISGTLLVIFKGHDWGITDEYFSHLIVELIGVFITVFLIDSVYGYVSSKNEELYRKLSLKVCKMPIFTYCAHWLNIFEKDRIKLDAALGKYSDLKSFFESDEFNTGVVSFNFNEKIGANKTFAQYYNEKMLDTIDQFQNIIAKYASKLYHKDLRLLEHFGGRAYFFAVFAVMKFLSEAKFSKMVGTGPITPVMPFINSFRDIKRKNFNKHFEKLIELIDAYNIAVDNDSESWTINNINKLNTTESANDNPSIEW